MAKTSCAATEISSVLRSILKTPAAAKALMPSLRLHCGLAFIDVASSARALKICVLVASAFGGRESPLVGANNDPEIPLHCSFTNEMYAIASAVFAGSFELRPVKDSRYAWIATSDSVDGGTAHFVSHLVHWDPI